MSRRILTAFMFVFIIFLYAPTIFLPIFAFNDSSIIAFPLSGFTFDWFKSLGAADELRKAAGTSLIIASVSSIIATTLGLLATSATVRYRFPGKGLAVGAIMLPMFLPEIIIGVSLLTVVLLAGFKLSIYTIIMGHVLICTPFCIAILRSSFQQLDPSLEEASLDLGESRVNTFRRVTLPLIMPGVMSSLLIGFTISLDEFVIAFFLSGTEPTLPVYIWSQLRFPQRIPSVMALGTLLLILSVVLLTLSECLRRRSARRLGHRATSGAL
ncbi:ABC transporter permease [Paracoccus sp. Ld10]|uniref:ABC transporter permease n=1 Tax=Paracoccus sp. Ld10 TaxID=649158 RepID=UPI003866215F